MASKPRNFNPDFYYHLYNRAIRENKTIFRGVRDYQRFINLLNYYRFKRNRPYSDTYNSKSNLRGSMEEKEEKVKIIAYVVMPNHFHLLVKPSPENPTAVSKFVGDAVNGYTRYYNLKNNRIGPLFQGKFSSKEINDEPSFIQVSRYLHLNPVLSTKTNPDGRIKQPQDYPYSSYFEWAGFKNPHLVDKEEVLRWIKWIGGPSRYREFVNSKIEKENFLGISDLIIETPEIPPENLGG